MNWAINYGEAEEIDIDWEKVGLNSGMRFLSKVIQI